MTTPVALAPLAQTETQRAGTLELRRFAAEKPADPAQQFEAFVLQSFVEEMLPKDTDSVYGGGISGGYWKSMMAEQLAGVIAERGDFGIAQYLRNGAGSGVALDAKSGQDARALGNGRMAALADAALGDAASVTGLERGE